MEKQDNDNRLWMAEDRIKELVWRVWRSTKFPDYGMFESWWEQAKDVPMEFVPPVVLNDTRGEQNYTWEDVQYYAWCAVEWAFKKRETIKRSELNDYLEKEK